MQCSRDTRATCLALANLLHLGRRWMSPHTPHHYLWSQIRESAELGSMEIKWQQANLFSDSCPYSKTPDSPGFLRGANPMADAFLPWGLLGKRVFICVSGEWRGFVRAGRHMAAFCHTNLPMGWWPLRSLCCSDPSGRCSWVPVGQHGA